MSQTRRDENKATSSRVVVDIIRIVDGGLVEDRDVSQDEAFVPLLLERPPHVRREIAGNGPLGVIGLWDRSDAGHPVGTKPTPSHRRIQARPEPSRTSGVSTVAKKKPLRRWTYVPAKPKASDVPQALKIEVETRANALVRDFLAPKYVEPPSDDPMRNTLTGLSTKWRGVFFSLVGHYDSPGPNALSSNFEMAFTRMEFAGLGRFHLAYFRHTGKWWKLHSGLTLDDCLDTIRDHGLFHPL